MIISFLFREESRSHVHVACPDGEAKFWLSPEIEFAKNHGLSRLRLKEIEVIIEVHYEELRSACKHASAEVTHISKSGVWLLTRDKELFMSYEDFPWFKDVPVSKILNVEEPSPDHFYWPDLDVDLTSEIIEYPERFPLKAK